MTKSFPPGAYDTPSDTGPSDTTPDWLRFWRDDFSQFNKYRKRDECSVIHWMSYLAGMHSSTAKNLSYVIDKALLLSVNKDDKGRLPSEMSKCYETDCIAEGRNEYVKYSLQNTRDQNFSKN